MLELKVNTNGGLVNVSSDPFVSKLENFAPKEMQTLAEKLTELLKIHYNRPDNDSFITWLQRHNYFVTIRNNDNLCHVPSSRFKPYSVGYHLTHQSIIVIINWMVEKYGIRSSEWSEYNSPRNEKLISDVKDLIHPYSTVNTTFKNEDMAEIESNILSLLIKYVDELPPREKVVCDNPKPKTYWQRFLDFFKET